MKKTEIAIVGGGITGLSAAYYLSLMGINDISIYEAKYIGYGSTGRCAAGIRASFTSDVHVTLMKEAIKGWKKWGKEIDGVKFYQDGYLWLLTSDDEVHLHKEIMKLHNSLGVPTKLLDRDKVKEVAPSIQLADVVAALYDPTAGKSSPFDTALALRRWLLKRGVAIHEYTKVQRLVRKGSKINSIIVEGIGEVNVKYVVIAAGYWSKELLRPLGYEIPIVGDPHHLMITEKVSPLVEPLVIHKASGSYLNQLPTGKIILGAEYPVKENDLELRIGFIVKAVKMMSRYFPSILNANLQRVWIGYYLKTPDHHPLIGYLPGLENTVIATGFSGHGYMMSPIVGEEIANIIVKGRPRLKATERLRPSRFEEGEVLEEKAIFG
jgi:sarcosine oxidase subunit beta